MISPLVSTQFVKAARINAFYYYAVSLSLGLVNVTLLLLIFRLRTADQILGKHSFGAPPRTHPVAATPALDHEKQTAVNVGCERPAPNPGPEAVPGCSEQAYHDTNTATKMRKMFSSPLLHCLALYSALYVGGEFTIGGWAVSATHWPHPPCSRC